MSQTTGRRARALLSFALVELYGDKVQALPYTNCRLESSQTHTFGYRATRQVTKSVSDKLDPLSFGTHIVLQVTRINEVCFLLNVYEARNLLSETGVQ